MFQAFVSAVRTKASNTCASSFANAGICARRQTDRDLVSFQMRREIEFKHEKEKSVTVATFCGHNVFFWNSYQFFV